MGILSKSAASSADKTVGHDIPVTRIAPSRGWINLGMKELWSYREMMYFLIWRDLKVKYRQTILGAAWAILQPLITMIVFTLVFDRIARVATGTNIPYPIFSYAGLVAWSLFAGALAASANSLVGSQNLIKKIYFPRLIIPIALSAAAFVEFFLSFAVLIVLMLMFGFVPTINIVFLPIFMIIAYIPALGMGLWLSALNVRFRDIRFVVPFFTQIWMFLTPVIYPSSSIQDPLARSLYNLNPMAGVVEGFRWALLGEYPPPALVPLVISTLGALLILLFGLFYFRRMEKTFADIV